MTSKDLKDLLGAVADEGWDTVDLDEQALAGRIKGRRRRNTLVAGAASLGTAAVIAIAAVAVVPNLGGSADTPVAGARQEASGLAIGACGGAVSGEPRAGAPLTLSAPVIKPISVASDFGTVDVVVTNTSGKPVDLTAGRSAAITLAQQSKVVGTPAPVRDVAVKVKLLPGEQQTITSTISLRRCGEAKTQAGEKLAPGSYQFYATQIFSPTDGGQEIEAQGGPWTVALK
ncbi:hypothetical protein [Kribbella italica]|uniref:Uncharacterized protein n=1 Tax=Kribbella italica TaxID=1540520 RepID=A0A7W9JCB0_9ACTN|nr:hypothetical protein [Kribbella italica]MBB5839334.1 hypothetical protein [Kribbella italica]